MDWVDDLNRGFEKLFLAGRWAVLLYRLSQSAHRAGIPLLPYMIQMLNAFLHGCEIHYRARIGKNLQIAHPRGLVVGQYVQAGKNLKLFTGAVLGVKHSGTSDQPRIGDDVTIYAGAKIIGPVHIGDNVIIGANAVVNRDVESDCVVAGIPAQVVKRIPAEPPPAA
jgi:serine O-acetyltransferase